MGGRRFKHKTVNNALALFLLLGVLGVWAGNHFRTDEVFWLKRWIQFTGEIIGATIAGWTLVIQNYFRKAPPNDNGGESELGQ